MTTSAKHKLLVGRERETGVIDAAVESLAAGQGQVLLLCGEPGIGKSTLARYAAAAAEDHGLRSYWGFAWEAGGAPAYWPWTQLLRSLGAEQRLPGHLAGKLAQLLPETATAGNLELNPDQARFILLDSMRLLLEHLGRKKPIMLCLEDLHAADSDSLILLQHVCSHIASIPVLIIGTYRDLEAGRRKDTDLLWKIARQARVMEPGRLGEADVCAYLAGKFGRSPDELQVRNLLAKTQGNPLFLTELVQWREAAGSVDFAVERLPESVQQVIRQQIGLLPLESAELLAGAAVQGRTFDPETLSELLHLDTSEVTSLLEPALGAGLVRPFDRGQYRFSHTLHREVLYQDMGVAERRQQHLAYAGLIRGAIAAGDEDRWNELAGHLDAAGAEYRTEAIGAWRRAAARALKRLAFEDAARQLELALAAFGAGPRYRPEDRCALMLEYAEATLLAGNIDAGQRCCRESFAIARTLKDARLMSRAALMWGSVFVVAKVDKDMIAALSECLECLPGDDTATRAQVQARLAAAMQPAPDPAGPMRLAREALALARETGDDEVLYQTLKSAISALMDFAPASERIPLNLEFKALATRFGDVPGRFRSNLRLMIDASEAGDRQMMVDAIYACDRLARRIDLPHYLWRAASARAMLATMEGRFARAVQLVNEAQAHADRIDDYESTITLPLQRFAILSEWEAETTWSLAEIREQLHHTFDSGMAEAEFFIAPYIRAFTEGYDEQYAREQISNTLLMERLFATNDNFLLTRIGELALLAGDLELAARVFEINLAVADECATLGLMGSTWHGPVSHSLGLLAQALGRGEEAVALLHKALGIATAMRSQTFIARIRLDLASVEMAAGNEQRAAEHEEIGRRMQKQLQLRPRRLAPSERTVSGTTPPAAEGLSFEKRGDVWSVTCRDHTVLVKDSKGMQMLSLLLGRPEQEVHVLELSGSAAGADDGGTGPALDAVARAQYKARIAELRQEMEEASELGDIGRFDDLRNEHDFITRELSRAFGLHGRDRPAAKAAERARVNVRRRIMDAISRVGEQSPEAGRYLKNTIKTGTYCKYSPM